MDKTTIIVIAVVAFLVLLCFLLAIASFSNSQFMETYRKLLDKKTVTSYKVSMLIVYLNERFFSNQVKIMQISQTGGDFYSSKKKLLGLNMTNEDSLASFAVVAHELGHAYQDIVEGKLEKFNALRKAGAFIGKLFLPILIVGIVLLFFIENYVLVLIGMGIGLFMIVFLAIAIKAKTIKIEKEASKKGLEFLKEILPPKEVKECKKLLDDARLTYWGDLIKLLLGWSGLTSKTAMFK